MDDIGNVLSSTSIVLSLTSQSGQAAVSSRTSAGRTRHEGRTKARRQQPYYDNDERSAHRRTAVTTSHVLAVHKSLSRVCVSNRRKYGSVDRLLADDEQSLSNLLSPLVKSTMMVKLRSLPLSALAARPLLLADIRTLGTCS